MNSDDERAYSLKQCLRWFDRDPTVIGSNRSKNRYDLDYIKSIKLPWAGCKHTRSERANAPYYFRIKLRDLNKRPSVFLWILWIDMKG